VAALEAQRRSNTAPLATAPAAERSALASKAWRMIVARTLPEDADSATGSPEAQANKKRQHSWR